MIKSITLILILFFCQLVVADDSVNLEDVVKNIKAERKQILSEEKKLINRHAELFFPNNSKGNLEFDITNRDKELTKSMSLITDKKIFNVNLKQVQVRLPDPCGEEHTEEEKQDLRKIGLYGKLEIQANGKPFLGSSDSYSDFSLSTLEQETEVKDVDVESFASEEYFKPINMQYYDDGFRLLKDVNSQQIYLEQNVYGRDVYAPALTLDGAKVYRQGPFLRIKLTRGLAIILVEEKTNKIILMSFSDYNQAKIDIQASYRSGNIDMYLVVLGEKGADARGILKHLNGEWTLNKIQGENLLAACD